jgi:PAS domain S-box-containing protein
VADIHGWTSDELIGQPLWLLFASDEGMLARERVATRRIGRFGHPNLYRHRTRSGREFAAEDCSTPIMHEGRPAWVGVMQDVSQRFAVERDLAESRQTLAAILDSTAAGILVVDRDEERCREAGMDAYVAKPIDPAASWWTIDRLLAPVLAAIRLAIARPALVPDS